MGEVRVSPDEAADAKPNRDEEMDADGVNVPEAAPLPRIREEPSRWEQVHRSPFVRVTLYYVLLIAVAAMLIDLAPMIRQTITAPVRLPALQGGMFGGDVTTPTPSVGALTLREVFDRAVATLMVILGALTLVFPVAWIYMKTKRLRYDPSLVRSVIILPIVVAGIVMVVKNSVALAFALAGIVAAVRFRNTLKDPRDAVYIFLTIAIGLSAGVQALDVALVMSMSFNYVVLILWSRNIGSIYGGRYGRTGILSTGAPGVLVAQEPEEQREIRSRLLEDASDMKTDGILLVHSDEPELARHTVQEALSEMAKDWRLVGIAPRGEGLSTLEYLVRLKKKSEPAELVGALDERWSEQVIAAEYLPFRKRKKQRDSAEKAAEGKTE